MIIKSIDLENIRSHKFTHIEFKNGLTVIMGDVGSGKTTILEGIKFALFGGTSHDYRNLLRLNETQGSVTLTIENSNKIFRITRKLKRFKDSFSGSNITVETDGKIKELSDREMKKFVLELFKIGESVKKDPLFFKNVIYASQEEMRTIMAMSEEERKEMIFELFQISSFNRIKENIEILKEKIKNRMEISRNLIGENGSKIIEINEKIKSLNGEIENINKDLKRLNDELKNLAIIIENTSKKLNEMENKKKEKERIENEKKIEFEKLKSFNIEIENRKNKLFELNKKKDQLETLKDKEKRFNEVNNLFLILSEKQTEFYSIKTKINKIEEELKNLNSQLNVIKEQKNELNNIKNRIIDLSKKIVIIKENEYENILEDISKGNAENAQWKKMINDLKNEIKELKSIENFAICPKCKRPMDREHVESIIAEDNSKIKDLENSIKNNENKIEKLRKMLENINQTKEMNKKFDDEINKLNIEKSFIEKNIKNENEIVEKINKLTFEMDQNNKKIKELNFDEKSFKELSKELDSLRKYHDIFITISNDILREDEIKNEIKNYELKLNEINKNIQNLDNELLKINYDENAYEELKLSYTENIKKESAIKTKIEDLKIKLNEKNDQLIEENEKLEELNREFKKLENYEKFLKWIDSVYLVEIDNIMRKRINTIRLEFKKEIEEWFRILLPDSEIDLGIDSNFSPVIKIGEFETDYEALSGGESAAVAFSYRLALNSLMKKFGLMESNFILLDEPTDGFSENQILRMGDIFSHLNVDQIIVVTHERELENFADHKITIRKDNGISIF